MDETTDSIGTVKLFRYPRHYFRLLKKTPKSWVQSDLDNLLEIGTQLQF